VSLAALLGAIGLAAVWVAVLAWSHWTERLEKAEPADMLGAESLYPHERLRVHDDPR
jgi:hypothetical protein